MSVSFEQDYFYHYFAGVYIHEFHKEWRGDYERLEDVHSYIQWLDPLTIQLWTLYLFKLLEILKVWTASVYFTISKLCCRLFPIQEQGMNWQAHVLSKQEIKVCLKYSVICSMNVTFLNLLIWKKSICIEVTVFFRRCLRFNH